jgi:IS30 family transposase
MVLHLPHGRSAEEGRVALTRKILKRPAELRRTLTWDQGKEMADLAGLKYGKDWNVRRTGNQGMYGIVVVASPSQ